MSYRNLIRVSPVAGLALLIVGPVIVSGQVVPASRTREQPAPTIPAARSTPRSEARTTPDSTGQATSREDEEPMDVLIAQALDQPTDLELKDAEIRDAFERLSILTGIPIEIDRGTVNLLPYGSKTLLTANIKRRPLRDSLVALLRPIGLKFEVESGRVMIRPTAALRRCVDRVTWTELALLEKLQIAPWNEEVASTLKFQFQNTPAAPEVNLATLLNLARHVGAGTASDVLEQATSEYGWTWYPAGDVIVVLPKPRQIERQLEKRVSLVFSQAGLAEVLTEITRRAGVQLILDPGVLGSTPTGISRFTTTFTSTPVRQVLDLISGQTGLAYFIEPEGVRISTSVLAGVTTRPAGDELDPTLAAIDRLRTNTVVGQITLPRSNDGSTITIFIRERDVPDDVQKMLPKAKAEAIEVIRAALAPTTRPAQ